ncbi:MAG: hypothetical protein ACRC1Z_24405 [Waterburya sp.]
MITFQEGRYENTMTQDFSELPPSLPVPLDDGAGDRLVGKNLPHVFLASTSGNQINLAEIKDRIVLYCYPMTGQPGVKLPTDWDLIPGARGCTPQSCSVVFAIIIKSFKHLTLKSTE